MIHSGMPHSSVGDIRSQAKEAIASQTSMQNGTEKLEDVNGCFSVHRLIIASAKPGPSYGFA